MREIERIGRERATRYNDDRDNVPPIAGYLPTSCNSLRQHQQTKAAEQTNGEILVQGK